MEGQVQGINIEEGGIASSVNMATLVYESWKQEGDQLVSDRKKYWQWTGQLNLQTRWLSRN